MIQITYDVEKYRNLLSETVLDSDIVLELGPHVGKIEDRRNSQCRYYDKDRDVVYAA